MSFEFDVVVLGAGPAGSAAAIECAKHRLSVLVIDAKRSPRALLGETLHPGLICLFKMLGVSECLSDLTRERPSGFEIRRGGSNQFIPYGFDTSGPCLGYTIWRHTLNSILTKRALNVGVTIWENCPASALLKDDCRIAGVIANKSDIHARFLIDATGAKRWLSRRLAIQYHEYSPRLLALYGYTPASCNQSGIPRWEADACSWSWTALVEPTVSSWTVLNLAGINQLSGRACRPDKRSKPVRGEDVSWRMASRCAGPGFFIIGDAAGLLDPGSSKGVLRALISGIKASYFILEILNGREREAAAYQAYSDWFQRLFMLEAAELSDRYRLLFPEIRWIREAYAQLEKQALDVGSDKSLSKSIVDRSNPHTWSIRVGENHHSATP